MTDASTTSSGGCTVQKWHLSWSSTLSLLLLSTTLLSDSLCVPSSVATLCLTICQI